MLTWVLLPLPALLAAVGLAAPAAVVLAGYAWVWLWMRPRAFVVAPGALVVEWPLRARTIPAADVAGVRTVTAAELRRELGLALRIGVGGLFGGFGMLWSRRGGLVDFYVTRLDEFVWIARRTQRPLLVSPEDAAGFAEALREITARA